MSKKETEKELARLGIVLGIIVVVFLCIVLVLLTRVVYNDMLENELKSCNKEESENIKFFSIEENTIKVMCDDTVKLKCGEKTFFIPKELK